MPSKSSLPGGAMGWTSTPSMRASGRAARTRASMAVVAAATSAGA